MLYSFRKNSKNFFSDSHVTKIRTLSVLWEYFGGPSAPIRARNGQGFVEISAKQGVAPAAPSRMLSLDNFEIDFFYKFSDKLHGRFLVFWYGLDLHVTGKYCKWGDVTLRRDTQILGFLFAAFFFRGPLPQNRGSIASLSKNAISNAEKYCYWWIGQNVWKLVLQWGSAGPSSSQDTGLS